MIWKQGRCDKCFTQETNNDHTHWGNAYRAGQCSLVQRTGQWRINHQPLSNSHQYHAWYFHLPLSNSNHDHHAWLNLPLTNYYHDQDACDLNLYWKSCSPWVDRKTELDVYVGVKAKNMGYLQTSCREGVQVNGCRCHGVQVNGCGCRGKEECEQNRLEHRRAFWFL